MARSEHLTDRFLWFRIRPITARRIANFRANRRALWSLRIFIVLFLISLFADFIANDRPILVWYDGGLYVPAVNDYPETEFGGEFETVADYTDPVVQRLIDEKGFAIWPLIRYSHRTHVLDLQEPAPTPPSWANLLGTDDQQRDVLARLIYGFRISVLFGLTLTLFSTVIGIFMGAIQGYFGGRVDLYLQRFMEVWDSIPILYLLIILAAIIEPGFWWLLGVMLLFSWMGLVGVVRAEFLRARNFDYVRAARGLGASNAAVMFKHMLPNAMVAALTFLPFILTSSIVTLSMLDYLGFGLPAGSASLGELLRQGKTNLNAPWLGLTAFLVLGLLLSLLIFIGEGVRDAFDPRKTVAGAPPPEPGARGPETTREASMQPAPAAARGSAAE